jgi:hypothetical protein
MNVIRSRNLWLRALTIATIFITASAYAQGDDPSLPRVVEQDGRHALLVDGAPYLILGAQSNNSSAWPAVLPKVWSAMDLMHVNTVEIPIYWEQFEPEQGRFDYTLVDTIINQAREHDVRLILLWFATWKSGSNHYMPQWMKLDPQRYPNMIGRDGKFIDSPSPHSEATLEADITAFTAFMRHLKDVDPRHTVIMVQVENEPGSWGSVRDYSPVAQKLFEGPVPAEALAAMQKPVPSDANWSAAFGKDADEYFQVWHVARFIGRVAAAGKAVYPLPMYVNGSVRDPLTPGWPPTYQVGGPNDNVFEFWKAAAPAIDLVAPDIYARDMKRYIKLLDFYNRPDNSLFVPETIGEGTFNRFFFAALGRGAIGYAPFGMDYTRPFAARTGAPLTAEEFFEPTALNFRLFHPMAREIARLNFEGKLQTAVEGEPEPHPEWLAAAPTSQGAIGPPARVMRFAGWDAEISFGPIARGKIQPRPKGEPRTGRVLIAQLGEDRFLMTGVDTRVAFYPTGPKSGRPSHYLTVEEGQYDDGIFKPQRILNGDQTDWGLVFSATPTVLRVSMYSR